MNVCILNILIIVFLHILTPVWIPLTKKYRNNPRTVPYAKMARIMNKIGCTSLSRIKLGAGILLRKACFKLISVLLKLE